MGKPAFCICENKAADQLCGNRTADQHLCFRYFLNPKFQASSHLLWLHSPVCVDLVGNPEDRFSHVPWTPPLPKWNGNGNAYDRGDHNSSFALRAVELKSPKLNIIQIAKKAFSAKDCQEFIRRK